MTNTAREVVAGEPLIRPFSPRARLSGPFSREGDAPRLGRWRRRQTLISRRCGTFNSDGPASSAPTAELCASLPLRKRRRQFSVNCTKPLSGYPRPPRSTGTRGAVPPPMRDRLQNGLGNHRGDALERPLRLRPMLQGMAGSGGSSRPFLERQSRRAALAAPRHTTRVRHRPIREWVCRQRFVQRG